MKNCLLIRYGEMSLKQRNRNLFEKRLRQNIARILSPSSQVTLEQSHQRLIVHGPLDQLEALAPRLTETPGILSVRPATILPLNWEEMLAKLLEILKKFNSDPQTFAVKTQRSDKRYFMDSSSMNISLGEFIKNEKPQWTVHLKKPDLLLRFLVTPKNIYLSTTDLQGIGGLPVGTANYLALLLSGGIDSPVAGYCMQKRGVPILAIHFHSFPYTGPQSLNKVKDLRHMLGNYQKHLPLYIVHFTDIQEAIKKFCKPKYGIILARRMMMRISENIAKQRRCLGLITGDSLGQVSSQTLENMNVIGSATTLPIYRPLISYDKQDIITIAKKINTFRISNRPFEDCCSLFIDKETKTRSTIKSAEQQEKSLNIDELVEEACQNIEIF
ncbi:tRNA 4-thiouridine(8) synthase ThiI [PVC group bacterium (ex Bugula neritina AB1)]|nr:tRNA 4-thiouridine(8) synthase ThiI [PVC group bacterium (ex Bugula neritina AB1)]